MTSRQILFGLAAAFVVVGLVLGFRTTYADDSDISCGSALSPSHSDAKAADYGEELGGTLSGQVADSDTTNHQDACDSAIGDAKPLTYGALALGAVALIAGLVAPQRAASSARQSGA